VRFDVIARFPIYSEEDVGYKSCRVRFDVIARFPIYSEEDVGYKSCRGL